MIKKETTMKLYQLKNRISRSALRKQIYISGSSAPKTDYMEQKHDSVSISDEAHNANQELKLLMLDEQRKINEIKYLKKLIADFATEEDKRREEIRKEVVKAAIRLENYDFDNRRAMQQITETLTALVV